MIFASHSLLAACIVSVGVSAVGLCLLVPISKPLGLLDYPDTRKRHAFATPLVGGLSVFVGLLAGWFWLDHTQSFDDVVVLTACALVALGALDDRYGLRVGVRVAVEVTAILVVIATTGVYVHSLGILHGYDLRLGWFGIPFTVVAVIGLINAFNLMDGIDGLAGSLALVSVGAITLLSTGPILPSLMVVMLLLAAALSPYLVSNLGLAGRRGKVFLGDSGSVVLGYVIAWTLIGLSQSAPRQISPGLVLWCVALPVMDTVAVMFRRLKRGVSPFNPDRTHIHHLLLNAGLGPRWTLVCLVGFAAVLPCVGLVARSRFGPTTNLVVFGVVLVLYVAFTAHFERSQSLRHAPAAAVPPMAEHTHH